MDLYTIYDHPKDYPDKIVVRRWFIGRGKTEDKGVWCLAKTLEEARESLPEGLVNISRYSEDDYGIIESWV